MAIYILTDKEYKIKIMKQFHYICLLVFFVCHSGVAQQDAQNTQYMYNTVILNPAYAGSRGVLSAIYLHRNQWVGMNGAPVTNTLSIHSPITKTLGVGGSFIKDKAGPQDRTTFSVDVSHSIYLTETYKLAFGVKGSLSKVNVDYNKLDSYILDDPANQYDSSTLPNIGAGIYGYSEHSYWGLSVPNLIENRNKYSTTNFERERLHFYFMGGYVWDLSDAFKCKPNLLTKWVKGSPLQVDLNLNFLVYDKFHTGASYRWQSAISGLVGFQLSKSLLLGYSYDRDTHSLGNYNDGSHEFFIRYEFSKKTKNLISPRFF